MSLRHDWTAYSTDKVKQDFFRRLQYAWHIVMDALGDASTNGARWASGRGNTIALSEIARDGGLARADTENDDDFRKRVAKRWDASRKLGSSGHLAREISLVFWDSVTGTSPRVTVFRQRDSGGGGVVVAVSDGVAVEERYLNSSFDWDKNYAAPCRIFIHVETTAIPTVAPAKWGDGTKWGDGAKWGAQFTGTQLLSVRAAIRRARAGHVFIQYLMAGPALSPTADYAAIIPQLTPGALFSGPGARSYYHPDGLGGYYRRAIGIPGQTLIDVDTVPA